MTELREHRIAFIAGTLGQGGAERQLFYILEALTGAGAACRVFTLSRGEFWEERIRATGVDVVHCGDSSSRLARILALRRAIRAFDPTIVQSQHFYTNCYAAAVANILHAHAIGAVRNDPFEEMEACGSPWGKLCLTMPDILYVNSLTAFRKIEATWRTRVRVGYLQNVIDTQLFHPRADAKTPVFTVLAVGRLVPQKRFDRVLDIASALRSILKTPFRFILVGDGPLRAALEMQAVTSGLPPDCIEFRGRVSDMLPLYQQADVLLSVSEYEGTPNVVLEAMACGLPVLATAAGDVPELIPAECSAMIHETYDMQRFVEALLEYQANPEAASADGALARRHVERRYSRSFLPVVLAKLYQSLLSSE